MNLMIQKIPAEPGPSIGAILIDSGRLTPEAAELVLDRQKTEGIRFGAAGVALGLICEEDIQQALARQYGYPFLAPGDDSVSEEVVAAFRPFSPIVEQLRALRSQLMMRWLDARSGRRALAVVSPDTGEGRSFIAANLAVVFSQLGQRTLLVDADLRRPRQHGLFRLPNRQGLSSVLAGRVEVGEAITRIPGMIDLSVLPAGAVPPNPQELLCRPQFAELMAGLQTQHEVVVVDTPAAGESADYQFVAAQLGGALVVARRDVSLIRNIQSLVSSLQQGNVAVIGTVLNNG
ncbi:chain length determinant protein tyrosine kinase EpsG [Accumulibacter sp.]|uniref:chain length determinant protein tyrosine kinase EpsG n=1 Tax=Accumulibacter sp. TaxID=2053492 RepID=UPI0025DC1C9E|nr:chain length determinant protein tyrosine kinase EpsG [Accumulibacter sp.]MCM8611618.1 chain length determinant protein tyrosine kinase EpsG [Accumulibacter sp.]MCM8635383.1 chain length determinant protein tyrosine kinase EpsG [Accumulibacter sp.]MCM8638988.1 chain length determinant protein tyrosine kinase EpsG [Accumulibacter sp.]